MWELSELQKFDLNDFAKILEVGELQSYDRAADLGRDVFVTSIPLRVVSIPDIRRRYSAYVAGTLCWWCGGRRLPSPTCQALAKRSL